MIFNIELRPVQALLGQCASLVLSDTYRDIQYWTQASTGPPWSMCQFGIVRYLPWYSILNCPIQALLGQCASLVLSGTYHDIQYRTSQYRPSLVNVPVWYCQVLIMIVNIELRPVQALLGQCASLVLSGTYHDIQYWTQVSTGLPWSMCQFGIVRYLPWYSILNSGQYRPSLVNMPVWYCQILTMIFNIELKSVQAFLGQCASLVLSGTYHDIQYWTQASTGLPWSMCQFGIVRYLPWYSILNSGQYRPSLVNVPVWYCQVLTMIFNIELSPIQALLGQYASLVLSGTYHDIQYWTQASRGPPWSMCQFGIVRYLPWYSILNSSQYRPSLVNEPVWYCQVLTMIFNIELKPVQAFLGQCASLVLSGTYHDIQYWTQSNTGPPWSICQFGIVRYLPW